MLQVGDNAPFFELESTDGGKISSNDLKGVKYVLYFYPKDNTSGCTKEAIEFTELIDEFGKNFFPGLGGGVGLKGGQSTIHR